MLPPFQYWYVLFVGSLGICCLCWRTSITLMSPSVVAKASIEVDLSLPSPSMLSVQRLFNNTSKRQLSARSNHHTKKRHHGPVSRFMIHLYNRRPNADIVRALKPLHVSSANSAFRDTGGTILEFKIPPLKPREDLQSAELFGALGTIVQVRSMDQRVLADVRSSRKDDNWRAFDVTSVIRERAGDLVKLLVNGRLDSIRNKEDAPILVVSYAKPKVRHSRAIQEDDHEDGAAAAPWIEEGGRRVRRRNLCRRRPLYVDFASIAYDEWVVAPPGYEAYQCVGKCFYPFGDHLSPTKHAIVQTLVHGALQPTDGVNGKQVGRACCVPTRLAPTSLLYIDASGTLTYQYGYEDMVVAECGCR